MRKTRVGFAVAAALGVACLAPTTSFGWSVDTELGVLSSDSGGDTLLFPIYTTAVGARTSYSVTNTSAFQTIAAKIRFREQEHSMDVLDFVVVLSPLDKFDFWISQGAEDERPVMRWNDNSCVVGPSGSGEQAFPPSSPFVETDEQMSVGHVEILGMADLNGVCVNALGQPELGRELGACDTDYPIDLGNAALHDNSGEPLDCALVVRALASPENVAIMNGIIDLDADPFVLDPVYNDVGNHLIGRYVITAADAGIEAGGDAIAIKDSNLTLTAQSGRDCINCESLYAWDSAEWDHPHLGEMENLDNFQSALTAQFVTGDWSNNAINFVGVDWVVSFPSKYAYLDYISTGECLTGTPGGPSAWCLLAAAPTEYGLTDIWATAAGEGLGDTNICLQDNTLDPVADTEEQVASGNVEVSPGTRSQLDLCNELNILTLAAEGDDVRDSVIQTADRRSVVGFKNLDALRGWGAMKLSWSTGAVFDDLGADAGAISGLIFTTRATGDPEFDNGSITELQKRTIVEEAPTGNGNGNGNGEPEPEPGV